MDAETAVLHLKTDPDPSVRRAAINYINTENCWSRDVFEAMAIGLEDPDDGIKDICSRVLSTAPDKYADDIVFALTPLIAHEDIQIRNLSADILVRFGKTAADSLLPYLGDSDSFARQFACEIIGKIGEEEYADEMAALLNDSDPNVVTAAVEALAKMGAERYYDALLAKYEYEELKPVVIASAGKIRSPKAQEFLLSVINNDEDAFMRTAAIEALAGNGEDMDICRELMTRLRRAKPEYKPILLKTIYAVSFRMQEFLELPSDLRYVAREALCDADPDMRAAGLIALGEVYDEADVPALINEVAQNNQETQRMILRNLISNCAATVLQKFLILYCSSSNPDGSDIEFLSSLPSLWSSAAEENKPAAVKTLIEIALMYPKGYSTEIVDIVNRCDSKNTAIEIENFLQSDNPQFVDTCIDIARDLKLNISEKVLNETEFQSRRLSEKARELAKIIHDKQ